MGFLVRVGFLRDGGDIPSLRSVRPTEVTWTP
jgi:hypothetical protein